MVIKIKLSFCLLLLFSPLAQASPNYSVSDNYFASTPLTRASCPQTSARLPKQLSETLYRAEYQLYWHELLVGTSIHTVTQTAATRYAATAQSFPKLKFLPYQDFERSEFTLEGQKIQPQRYDFKTQDNRKNLAGHFLFDWKKRVVIKTINHKTEQPEPLPPLAQDKITHFFQLREDLKAQKKHFEYTVIEPNKIKHWRIRILGTERLNTPLGSLHTVKLEHVSDNQERRTQFWLAKDLDYLMVKLIQIRKGKKTAEVFIHRLITTQRPDKSTFETRHKSDAEHSPKPLKKSIVLKS